MAEIGVAIATEIGVAAAASDNSAGYLVKGTIRQLRYMFCFSNIVEELKEENKKLTKAHEQMKEDVKQARGNAEKIRENVETWLTAVDGIIEEVESFETEVEEKKMCLNGWCPNWYWRYRLSRKAAKKKLAIKTKLVEGGKFRQLGDSAPLPIITSSEDFMLSKAAESASHQIMDAMKDDSVNVIILSGMAGVGKTTLATKLGVRAKESKLFDEFVMAAVSQTPNVKLIQRKIADLLRLKFDEEDEIARASRLTSKLDQVNKILIILDDVWDNSDLSLLTKIGIPFLKEPKRCKILLTTRCQQVGMHMKSREMKIQEIKLEVLTEDEAWTLFKEKADLGDDSSPLTAMARKIASKGSGLPLAIVTMARTLRGKTHHEEWKLALKQLENPKFANYAQDIYEGIDRCFVWSYDYLKNKEIKLCFLMCSLFPEDYEIPIEELVRFGWGIRLFKDIENIEDARTETRVMMRTLQDLGLLLHTHKDGFVKMHDLVVMLRCG